MRLDPTEAVCCPCVKAKTPYRASDLALSRKMSFSTTMLTDGWWEATTSIVFISSTSVIATLLS